MKRFAIYASISLATVLVILFLYRFRVVLALLIASLALAAAVRPLIASLTARGLSHPLSVGFVYLSGLLLLAAIIVVFGALLRSEVPRLAEDLARAYELLHPAWQDGSAWQQMMVRRLPSPETFYESIGGEEGELFAQQLLQVTRRLLAGIGLLLLTIIVSLYWAVDQPRAERLGLSFFSPRHRQIARGIWRDIGEGVGGYLRSEGTQTLIALIALTAGYHLLGLPYPTILALGVALAWLVPLVGVLLALPMVIASGLIHGLLAAAAAVLYTLAIFAVLEYIVEPRIRQRHRFSPILTILAMLVLLESFGLLGLILAPFLSMAVQITLSHTVSRRRDAGRQDGTAPKIGDLRHSLEALRSTLDEMEDRARPELVNLAGRLENLLQMAETPDGEPALERDESGSTPSKPDARRPL